MWTQTRLHKHWPSINGFAFYLLLGVKWHVLYQKPIVRACSSLGLHFCFCLGSTGTSLPKDNCQTPWQSLGLLPDYSINFGKKTQTYKGGIQRRTKWAILVWPYIYLWEPSLLLGGSLKFELVQGIWRQMHPYACSTLTALVVLKYLTLILQSTKNP